MQFALDLVFCCQFFHYLLINRKFSITLKLVYYSDAIYIHTQTHLISKNKAHKMLSMHCTETMEWGQIRIGKRKIYIIHRLFDSRVTNKYTLSMRVLVGFRLFLNCHFRYSHATQKTNRTIKLIDSSFICAEHSSNRRMISNSMPVICYYVPKHHKNGNLFHSPGKSSVIHTLQSLFESKIINEIEVVPLWNCVCNALYWIRGKETFAKTWTVALNCFILCTSNKMRS